LKVRDIDIVNEVGFKPANLVFQALTIIFPMTEQGTQD
jgi:hypothetical protein